jgi:CCR4-NOT transcription complex subunit 6
MSKNFRKNRKGGNNSSSSSQHPSELTDESLSDGLAMLGMSATNHGFAKKGGKGQGQGGGSGKGDHPVSLLKESKGGKGGLGGDAHEDEQFEDWESYAENSPSMSSAPAPLSLPSALSLPSSDNPFSSFSSSSSPNKKSGFLLHSDNTASPNSRGGSKPGSQSKRSRGLKMLSPTSPVEGGIKSSSKNNDDDDEKGLRHQSPTLGGMDFGFLENGHGATGVLKSKTGGKLDHPIVTNLSLLYDPPVEGCLMNPYVSIQEIDGTVTALRSHKDSKLSDTKGHSVGADFKWSRGQQRICSVPNCGNAAAMQCLVCMKAKGNKGDPKVGYFCSNECFAEAWPQLKKNHEKHAETIKNVPWRVEDEEEPIFAETSAARDSAAAVNCKFPPEPHNEWKTIARTRAYTPKVDDVGCALKVEATPLTKDADFDAKKEDKAKKDKRTKEVLSPGMKRGDWATVETMPVKATPPPPNARNVIYNPQNHLQANPDDTFKMFNYNVLAQMYATRHMYPYTEIWALSWGYRKRNILREIVAHDGDILCLQEVQANHYERFFSPELAKLGYDGLYKRKTREAIGDNPNVIDGCAIFYRRSRFELSEQYGIEFNEAARQHFASNDRDVMRRLLKGNIGLVVVLQEVNRNGRPGRQLCVCNTHTYWDPEFADVKLWQTWVLCKELEEFAVVRSLPLLLCGDFNSIVNSAVYELLATERVNQSHPIFSPQRDPARILPDPNEIAHGLDLQSAYAFMGEPKYTNYTANFVGVLDYIFFTKQNLIVSSVVDVSAEKEVSSQTAIPNPQFPSDHVSLIAEIQWINY